MVREHLPEEVTSESIPISPAPPDVPRLLQVQTQVLLGVAPAWTLVLAPSGSISARISHTGFPPPAQCTSVSLAPYAPCKHKRTDENSVGLWANRSPVEEDPTSLPLKPLKSEIPPSPLRMQLCFASAKIRQERTRPSPRTCLTSERLVLASKEVRILAGRGR